MENTKNKITEKLQAELKTIRLMLGFSSEGFADLIGLSRQTISSLETGKTKISDTQVIAVLAIIDRRLHQNSFEFEEIKKLLEIDKLPESPNSDALLDTWFYLSGLQVKQTETITKPKEEIIMKYIVNIIDVNQLITDADVILKLADAKNQEIYLPVCVEEELSKLLDKNIMDKKMTERIIHAKKVIQQNHSIIRSWKAKSFTDSAIQQLVLEKMCLRSVEKICIYTQDKALARDCENLNNVTSINHTCQIEALTYKNGETYPTNTKIHYPYELTNLEAVAWREQNILPEFNKSDSLNEEPCPIEAPNKNSTTTKYWLWYAKKGDVLRVYKKIKLYKGQVITADVLSYDMKSNAYARLLAYRESDNTTLTSDYVPIGDSIWKKLKLEIDSDDYNFINVEIRVNHDAEFNGYWEGHDGFVNNFTIIK